MFFKTCAQALLDSEHKAAGSIAKGAHLARGKWVRTVFRMTCLQTPVAILRKGSWDFMQSCMSLLTWKDGFCPGFG